MKTIYAYILIGFATTMAQIDTCFVPQCDMYSVIKGEISDVEKSAKIVIGDVTVKRMKKLIEDLNVPTKIVQLNNNEFKPKNWTLFDIRQSCKTPKLVSSFFLLDDKTVITGSSSPLNLNNVKKNYNDYIATTIPFVVNEYSKFFDVVYERAKNCN